MKRFAEFTGVDITNLIHNVVESFADRSAYSLGESQHAPNPQKGSRDRLLSKRLQASEEEKNFTPSPSSSPPTSFSTPLLSAFHNNTPHPSSSKSTTKMAPAVADINDTAAFMAAARSFKLEKEYGKPPAACVDAVDENPGQYSGFAFDGPTDGEVSGFNGFDAAPSFDVPIDGEAPTDTDFNDFNGTPDFGASNGNDAETSSLMNFGTEEISAAPVQEPTFSVRPQTPEAENVKPEPLEDREHMTTFKTWGVPAARGKPAAQIRRCVIKGLPPAWSTPDKVLSLVHGGMIESVSVTPTGNAHVLFCDAAACKAFFDHHPNGIDLDRERKLAVFVDLGVDVDVVSSQLSQSLAVGSSRVVRAVGVEMDVTPSDIVKVATATNSKVEKIIDSYVPGAPRAIIFRFCSITDAVRFRSALVRDEGWEHCNIHFTTDPCEVATGYHAD